MSTNYRLTDVRAPTFKTTISDCSEEVADIFCWMQTSKKTKSLSNPAAAKLQKDAYNLPAHDALAQILPAKSEPLSSARQEQQTPAERAEAPQGNKPNINHTYQAHRPHKRSPLREFEDDPHMAQITDLQVKEVENYRSAMSRMAEDIITLKTQVVMLEAENSQLRSDLSLHRDLGRDLLDDADIDVMTKAEIADRIVNLKFKLASETNKTSSQRDRIQQLQNELIRKNDSEKQLLKLQRVHQQQQEDLHHHQKQLAKTATLEVTVKQQEKVIEKMEKALDRTLKETNKQSGNKKLLIKMQKDEADCRKEEIETALAAENDRLRKELERIRQTKDKVPHREKLTFLNKLEMAEAKIKTLEAQLEENAKSWGRQKQEMLTKLSEQRQGFVRTSTAILHKVPSIM